MGACRYVGRVGGLAVALGVGAAVFGGAGVAWADEAGPSATAASAERSVPARAARGAAEAGVTKRVVRSDNPSSGAAAATPRAVAPMRAASVADRVSTAIAVPGVSQSIPESAAAAAPASAPSAPASAGLDWTMLAAARRESLVPEPLPSAAVLPAAAQPTALIMGPSGVPIPKQDYIDTVMEYYVLPNSPAGTVEQTVFTPEGLYPITGVKSLELNTSVDEGIDILDLTMEKLETGTETSVFGYSQSAIIGALMQRGFKGYTVPENVADTTQFIFVGNEMNPDGGLLSRFPGLTLPSLGLDFYGATPENAYRTINYTQEYDGFADFPRYPLNFLSDLNAIMGIFLVHTRYADPTYLPIGSVTPISRGGTAIELPTTSILTQSYYFIRTENLPLLAPLREIPIIGKPLAALIQPALKVIVDLGYGDPAHGFLTGTQPFANVETPFGLFPDVDPMEVLTLFVAGVEKGIEDFIHALGPDGSVARELSELRLPSFELPTLPTPDRILPAIAELVTEVADRISGAAASLYAVLLPTADIINAVLLPLPAYNLRLFVEGIEQALTGDVINGVVNALLRPVAADVGLVTLAAMIGLAVWGQGITGAVDDIFRGTA